MTVSSGKLRAAIVGASGYAGSILCGLLLRHPGVELTALYVSEKSLDAGKRIVEIDARLAGKTDLTLTPLTDVAAAAAGLDIVFLATDHAVSARVAPLFIEAGVRAFDLSGAFRLSDPSDYPKYYGFEHESTLTLRTAVYALAEFTEPAQLKKTLMISLPGCYPTASQLALKPLIDAGVLDTAFPPVIDAVSGVSGAGRKAKLSNAFCEVSLAAYGVFTHRHRPEIEEHLGQRVIFTPHLGPFKRGILATITARLAQEPRSTKESLTALYRKVYAGKPLVRIKDTLPQLGAVQELPYCDIGCTVDEKGEYVVIVSAIDNLLKGAAAQAVQVMNLTYGFEETEALL